MTIGGSAKCELRNKCGTNVPNFECCITAKFKFIAFEVELGFVTLDLTLLELEKKVRYNFSGGGLTVGDMTGAPSLGIGGGYPGGDE